MVDSPPTGRDRGRLLGWAAMGVVLVVMLTVFGRSDPTSGTGDDRLHSLAGELKCLQCVGESVASSQSNLAVEFRSEIRRRMAAGDSDDEILAYFASTYGEQVLLRPPGTGLVGVVWVLPVVLAAVALAGVVLVLQRWRREAGEVPELSAAGRETVEAELRRRGSGSQGPGADPRSSDDG